jgi:hypothetical protein
MRKNPPGNDAEAPVSEARRPRTAMTPAFLRLWGWPIVLGLSTASGLASALASDGWGDAWSWAALGAPVVVITERGLRRTNNAPAHDRKKTTNPRTR